MTRLGLTLNEAKTSIRDARQERFDFLGYTFGPHRYRKDGHWYLGASPSRKSVQRLKDKVGDLLVPGNKRPWPEVRDQLNACCGAGRPTSAMARGCRRIGRSTITSTTASATSSSGVTRCKRAARDASRTISCSGNSACSP